MELKEEGMGGMKNWIRGRGWWWWYIVVFGGWAILQGFGTCRRKAWNHAKEKGISSFMSAHQKEKRIYTTTLNRKPDGIEK
jgi:hypothetical protein